MSTVEIAVKQVKGLSNRQARELLKWLAAHDLPAKPRPGRPRRKGATRPTMRKVMSWYSSVRGTTDWEPPRMPPDLVASPSL